MLNRMRWLLPRHHALVDFLTSFNSRDYHQHHHIRLWCCIISFTNSIFRNLISYLVRYPKIYKFGVNELEDCGLARLFHDLKLFCNFIKYPRKLYSGNHHRVSVSNSKFLWGNLVYELSSHFYQLLLPAPFPISLWNYFYLVFLFFISPKLNKREQQVSTL